MRRLVPNAISALRLLLIPVLAWAIWKGHRTEAIAILVASAGSDWLDGFLARRWRVTTRLGTVLDPLADKLTQLTGLVLLATTDQPAFTPIPELFVALVLARDLTIVYGVARVRRRRGRVELEARFEGKASTVLVFLLLLVSVVGAGRVPVLALSIVTAPLVVAAGVRYTLEGIRQIKRGTPYPPGAA